MRRFLIVWLALAAQANAFERALPGREFTFPRDHFSHPSFEIEWWYYTGNLETAQGRRFGFELTFFRNALERREPPSSPWDVDQIYLAHFAISDLERQRFWQADRLNRAGPGLAGAAQPAIWNGNWSVEWLAPEEPLGPQRLRAMTAELDLDLRLTPAKPAVIHGRDGVSQKAAGVGRASHYISFTRLASKGELRIGDETFSVEGLSWMDHEFSTNSLGPGQVGWDWMSAQFADGSELMLYRMRRDDGATDPHSSGTYVSANGEALHLTRGDFEMKPGKTWQSSETGGAYPIEWQVRVPPLGLEFSVSTPFPAQEMQPLSGEPAYWEGAVDYIGMSPKGPLRGRGYLEMTGYDRPLELGVPDGH